MSRFVHPIDEIAQRRFERHLLYPDPLDERVRATPGIDTYCSSSCWTLAAFDAFVQQGHGLLYESPEASMVVYDTAYDVRTRGRFSLDSMWGLASSVMGSDPAAVGDLLASAISASDERRVFWYVTGMPEALTRSAPFRAALSQRRVRYRSPGESVRMIASLDGGVDGYLGRRSRKFRKALRSGARRCGEAAVQVTHRRAVSADEADGLFLLCRTIEQKSWKGIARCGFAEGPMHDFVRNVCIRSAEGPGLDVLIAHREDDLLAFLIGVQQDGSFRGIQMSYDEAHRELSLGSLLQMRAIELAIGRGATSYDLGSDGLAYKRDWAERAWATSNLLLMNATSELR